MTRMSCGCLLAFIIASLSVTRLDMASGETDQVADSAKKDCLKKGDAIGVFYVTKVAGAEDDGVEPGEDLCYRCRYGSSPIVMVFARKTGARLTELVRRIDSAVTKHQKVRLKGLITMMGEDASEVKKSAGQIAAEAEVTHVPVVIAKQLKTGPVNYKLASNAAVTILVAKDSQVVNLQSFDSERIDIAGVMSQVERILR